MSTYIFESIDFDKKLPVKSFVTRIEKSSFHWHYEYELILVLKGSVILNTSPERSLLQTGDIALINSKSVHELRQTHEDNLCLFAQISHGLLSDNTDENKVYHFYLNSALDELSPKKPYSHFARQLSDLYLASLRDDNLGYQRSRSLLYGLAADIFEFTQYEIHQKANTHAAHDDSKFLVKIIEFVEKNLCNDSVMEDLYHALGVSQKTIYRFLKNSVGLSLKDIVDSSRVEAAKLELITSDKSISFIADKCGFGSENTFYRVFKKETNMTPQDYRKNSSDVEANPEVRGYLDYSQQEARAILREMFSDNDRIQERQSIIV